MPNHIISIVPLPLPFIGSNMYNIPFSIITIVYYNIYSQFILVIGSGSLFQDNDTFHDLSETKTTIFKTIPSNFMKTPKFLRALVSLKVGFAKIFVSIWYTI